EVSWCALMELSIQTCAKYYRELGKEIPQNQMKPALILLINRWEKGDGRRPLLALGPFWA
ncbi:MAG TPA: hypothetical protein VMG63_01990, partial [Terriglobia bacterium]|nr:hypothetical protein [Terriglobia bacterium]